MISGTKIYRFERRTFVYEQELSFGQIVDIFSAYSLPKRPLKLNQSNKVFFSLP